MAPLSLAGFCANILAHRIQEKAYGGLSPKARKKLLEIAESLNTTSRKLKSTSVLPGTRLLRSRRGVLHQVKVLLSGYEYNGKSYDSLSVIAREITGTRWPGPLFFGTKKRRHDHENPALYRSIPVNPPKKD